MQSLEFWASDFFEGITGAIGVFRFGGRPQTPLLALRAKSKSHRIAETLMRPVATTVMRKGTLRTLNLFALFVAAAVRNLEQRKRNEQPVQPIPVANPANECLEADFCS